MWSRLAKVATDLAQDLAQPEEAGDDEEEYYEEDGGWGEDDQPYSVDGEVQQLQTPPAAAAAAPEEYYEEGEAAYVEGEEYHGEEGWGEEGEQQQYYEEGEEAQQVYEEEEGQDYYQEEEEGWGEAQPQEDAAGGAADDWDLEDEDLFGDDEEGGEQQQQQQEEPVGTTTDGEVEGIDHAAGNDDDNYNNAAATEDDGIPDDDDDNNGAWGNDDSLNFDDSLIEAEGVAAVADDANVQQVPPPSTAAVAAEEEPEIAEIENEMEENEWGNDDSFNFDNSHMQEEEGGPVEELGAAVEEGPVVEEAAVASDPDVTEIDNNLVENEWGNDDSLKFDDSHMQEGEVGGPAEEAPLVEEGEGAVYNETSIVEQNAPVEEDTQVDENAWGDDDLGLDDSFAPTENHVTGDEIETEQQQQVQEQPEADAALTIPMSHDTFDTAEENQENAWNDDLAFDDDNNQETTAADNGGATTTSDLIVQESHDTFDTAEQEPETSPVTLSNHVEGDAVDAVAEEGSGWNDDDDADAMFENNEGTDGWGGDDNLNLSTHDEEGAAFDPTPPVEPELSEQVAAIPTEEELHHATAGTLAADSADAWGDDDDLNLSDDVPDTSAGANPAEQERGSTDGHPSDDLAGSSLASVVNQEDELQVFEDEPADNAWNDTDLNFEVAKDDKKHEAAIPDEQEVVEEEQGEDDSTVEQSNIGFEQQSVEELLYTRRATFRVSNTSADSQKGAAGGIDTFGEQILGTSVTFTEQSISRKTLGQPSMEAYEPFSLPSGAAADLDHIAEESVNQDALSTVSDLTDIPKPRFETQISTMTLKSMADSRQNANGSDDDEEDDEDDYGLVVDKTPELNAASTPQLSTMTINSTAVVAPSVNDDIQKDEDMDGTFYGGSATGEAQSTENAWEDDASSLGGMSEKMVNFEVTASVLGPPNGAATTPLTDTIPEETTNASPPLDSSMALLYADDTSVPSRDKDDDNEDNYKPVVDQIPRPLKKKLLTVKSGGTLNSTGALADIPDESENHDESSSHRDTEGGHADGWDDGVSLEDVDSHDDDSDQNGQDGSATADKGESHIVVDKTPNDAGSTGGGKTAGSVAAVESVENSCPSRVHGDDEEVYGLVVDQIPALTPPSVLEPSVAASCMAVATNVDQDLRQDEELDASDRDDSVLGELGVSSEATEGIAAISSGSSGGDDRVVDLTPKMGAKKMSRLSSGSLVVLAHSVNQDFADEDNYEDNDANFGPVVDIAAVEAMAKSQEEVKQDETTNGSIGDVGWDDDCPELEDMELGEETEGEDNESEVGVEVDPQPSGATKQVTLVDHTPEAQTETLRKAKGDASLAVLAPSEDGTCLSINDNDDDADTIDPHGERVSYGPVVDHLPNLPSEFARAPSTALSVTFSLAVEARSVDDQTLEELDDQTIEDIESVHPEGRLPAPPSGANANPEAEVMVDHTPQLSALQPRMGDASLVTLAPSETGTFHSADDSARDDDTITHEEDMYGKVVDHTPRTPIPFVKSTSMAVEASSADCRSAMEKDGDLDATSFDEIGDQLDDDGWGEDEDALDEIEAGQQIDGDQPASENLVDHTPEGEEQPAVVNSDPSVAVLAPSEDGSHAEDDNDPNDGNHAYGPVVDVCPGVELTHEAPDGSTVAAKHDDGDLEGTLFGDSTVGGEGGWDDDDAILDDLVEGEGDVEAIEASSSHAVRWQKHAESTDNASSQMDDSTIGKSLTDAASVHDGVVVVDHTPSEVDSSAQKNSVGWLTNVESGISGDETAEPVVSWEVNDGAEPPNAAADEDQVVDRIPQRPESRFGDASTIVVADPSEVLSHVDDMLQEEGDFGPVVDLTPPTRPASVLTATGSTAVVAPTVVHDDDLDDADPDPDDTVNAADEENAWAEDPAEAPNPQSGNEEDEAARRREQVVDFLPPQEEQAADPNRDGWSEASEVATGGAPSVLQADPKEDDYGRKYFLFCRFPSC